MRTLRLISLALVLTLTLGGVAEAAKKRKKPVKVRPAIALAPTLVVGANVSPEATVTFKLAKSVKPKTACKGKVTVSAPIGKKKVKKTVRNKRGKKVRKTVTKTVLSKKNAKLKAQSRTCTATAKLKLPATLAGKSLRVTAQFKGNKAVKKFKQTRSLKVTLVPFVPPVPPAPQPPAPQPPTPSGIPPQVGWWGAFVAGETQYAAFRFDVLADRLVSHIKTVNGVPITCDQENPNTFPLGYDPVPDEFSLAAPPVTITGAVDGTPPAAGFISDVTLDFSSPTSGTMTISSTGGWTPGIGDPIISRTNCTTGGVQTLTLKPMGPPN